MTQNYNEKTDNLTARGMVILPSILAKQFLHNWYFLPIFNRIHRISNTFAQTSEVFFLRPPTILYI